nr:hypothetical protein [Tanacetum cinerariifolium]
MKGGKRDGNKPDAKPLKSILKKNGVDIVITDVSVDSYFGLVMVPNSPRMVLNLMVLEHGLWLIRNVPFILRKWTLCSKLSKEELNSIYTWIKLHGVPISAFTADDLSAITTHLGTPVMLDSCTVEYERKPLRRGTYLVFAHDDIQCTKRVMADLRKQGGNSNDGFRHVQKMAFCGPLISKYGTGDNHSLPKQQVPKFAYQKKTTSTTVSNAFSTIEEDNGKHMDDLVHDTRKKVEASHRKIGICSGRKADSPKRNIVFSLETKLNYFNKDDIDFDDMKQAVKEAEHGNAFSENG